MDYVSFRVCFHGYVNHAADKGYKKQAAEYIGAATVFYRSVRIFAISSLSLFSISRFNQTFSKSSFGFCASLILDKQVYSFYYYLFSSVIYLLSKHRLSVILTIHIID